MRQLTASLEGECINDVYCTSNEIQASAQTDIAKVVHTALSSFSSARLGYLVIMIIVGMETIWNFLKNDHFASSPLTLLLSLKEVGYLMVTCLVIMIWRFGAYMSFDVGW